MSYAYGPVQTGLSVSARPPTDELENMATQLFALQPGTEYTIDGVGIDETGTVFKAGSARFTTKVPSQSLSFSIFMFSCCFLQDFVVTNSEPDRCQNNVVSEHCELLSLRAY